MSEAVNIGKGKAAAGIPIANELPESGMLPNMLYEFGTLSQNHEFRINTTDINPSVANLWHWTFKTSAAITVTWPNQITSWAGGNLPEISEGKYYEVSVMGGIACIIET